MDEKANNHLLPNAYSANCLFYRSSKLSPQGNVNLKTADVYYSQQDVEQAEIYYLKVLEDNPDHAIALRRLGDISLFKAENFSAGKLNLRRCLPLLCQSN